MLKKIPWGIIAGVCVMIVFYATVAVVALYIVNSGVAAQTNQTTTIFGTWYQTLIFVVDLFAVLGFCGSLTMFVLKRLGKLPESGNEAKEGAV